MKRAWAVGLIVLIAVILMTPVANSSESIPNWNVSGSIQVVYDCDNATSACWLLGGSGVVTQSVEITSTNYSLSAWCIGNAVVTLEYNGVLQTQSCAGATAMRPVILTLYNTTGGTAVVGAQLSAGDKVDTFCLFSSPGYCNNQATSLVKNFGFDDGQLPPATPTPTCTPKGKSGKCR